jgi:hypothetical protein
MSTKPKIIKRKIEETRALDGRIINNQMDVQVEARVNFKSLLALEGHGDICIHPLFLEHISQHLERVDNEILWSSFFMEEVKVSTFQLHSDKVLRSYGFVLVFLKICCIF